MCHIVDIDGTVFYFGTLEPLPGAMRGLREWQAAGDQILITTGRRDLGAIKRVLNKHGVFPMAMLGDVQNPRHLVNDGGAYCTNHPTDAPWG
jgi:hypothetical protein